MLCTTRLAVAVALLLMSFALTNTLIRPPVQALDPIGFDSLGWLDGTIVRPLFRNA